MEFETIRDDLETKICRVEFIKKNGEHRTMFATLAKSVTGHFGPVVPSKLVLPVWSMEDRAWRSFNLDNVREFTVYCYPGSY